MSSIIPFSFESHEIRTLADSQGAPWFVLRDVMEAMDSKTSTTNAVDSIKTGLGDGYSLGIPIADSLGREQSTIIIAESAVTYLLSRSDTEQGRLLNRFIHVDVLPALRKTGKYEAPAKGADLPRPREIREAFACCLSIAKMIGLSGNQASLSADTGTRRLTGVSALALIDQTHLVGDARGRTYTPTELGKLLAEPLSAVKMNRLLEAKGLQVKNIGGDWLPTTAAQDCCQWLDTHKAHHDGTPVKQLRWFAAILPRLEVALAATRAA
ncbi:MAG: hypothetical protein KAX46_11425 [Chromatiaceae bacterium]|nr:hypothetical protein [Chromatiaceae bacterium]